MTFASGYRGTAHGSVQTTYQDQPGVAVPGMLAFASDYHNTDAIFIGEANGIAAGKGVRLLAANEGLNFQRPPVQAFLPEGDGVEAVAEFGGVVVFDEAMQSDENGVPGWAYGRVARIVRPGRAGGRVYVSAKDTITPGTSTVNWVIVAPADGSYELGDFAPSALGGGDAGTSVALTNCSWVTPAVDGEVAILEMHGNVLPTLSEDSDS